MLRTINPPLCKYVTASLVVGVEALVALVSSEAGDAEAAAGRLFTVLSC